jgi:hypothetical protein
MASSSLVWPPRLFCHQPLASCQTSPPLTSTQTIPALDRDHEVDLVVFEVVGVALAGDEQIAFAELVNEQLPALALGLIGEARLGGEGDGHLTWGLPQEDEIELAQLLHIL